MKNVTSNVQKVVFRLPIGTEYVVIQEQVLLIAALDGSRSGGCFYPAGSSNGYLVRKRDMTAKERVDLIKSMAVGSPTLLPAGAGDFSDWK